jgi:hypothetical protein
VSTILSRAASPPRFMLPSKRTFPASGCPQLLIPYLLTPPMLTVTTATPPGHTYLTTLTHLLPPMLQHCRMQPAHTLPPVTHKLLW